MESALTQPPISSTAELETSEPLAPTSRGKRCIHTLFEEHVQAQPEAVALVCGNEALTYRQLNRRANRLAHHLQKRGIGPNALVGICMHRCVEMIVSVLGVLKAGGAYIPFDPSYPKRRLATMLSDVELAVLLTKHELLAELPESDTAVLCLDRESDTIEAESEENPGESSLDDLAYAIFTSGSTGQAKAAAVYHRGWSNLLDWFVSQFEIGAADRVLVISSFSFDITQRSIAMPLITGGELHLLASRHYDPATIREVIAGEEITLVNCAPSTFYPLVEVPSEDWRLLAPLRIAFLGGEPISASRLREWALSPQCSTDVVNVYGVAECSDVSTFHRLQAYDRYAESSVPIGKPIFNSEIHLLDESLAPVAGGERGEICIAGEGVGKGYINDPLLTEDKFIANPFSSDPRARLYRTGDLGRSLADGTLELIGRVDHQVKIRGHRIDLGDIETSLRLHPDVREAVVISRIFNSGDTRLVAYVVPGQALEPEEHLAHSLRRFASERLPVYMMPSRFEMIDELPLNPNGKVDRTALATQELAPPGQATRTPLEDRRSPLEARVAATFAEVLEVEEIGSSENFFDHGGDSYLATVLLGRLTDFSGVRLSIFDLLSGATVADVTKAIEESDGD